MNTLPEPWDSVIDEGPRALSRHLWRFLSGEVVDDSDLSSSPEYVADLYATLMSESQRSCMRDAITIALNEKLDGTVDSAEIYIALTSLASDVQLLSVRSTRSEDRLWTAVRQSQEFSPQVSSLLSLLGAEGSIRPEDEWSDIYQQFGPESAIACVEGVRRYGVLEAFHWIYATFDTPVTDSLMPAWLPILFEEDMPSVVALLRNPRGDREILSRSMLTKWLSRYDISLPAKYREPPVDPTAASALALNTMRHAVSFSAYVELDGTGRTPAEVAAIWATVEDEAPWPVIFHLEGHSDG